MFQANIASSVTQKRTKVFLNNEYPKKFIK